MRAASWLLGLLLLAPRPAAPEVTVRSEPGRVLIDAQAAPLDAVLARFAEGTGLELIYDGAPPRTALTARIEDASSARVLVRLLEGSGLNYALTTDATGQRAVKLYVTTSPTTARPAPRNQEPEEFEPVDPEAEPEAPEVGEEDDAAEDLPEADAPPQGPAFPVPNYPTSSFTPRAPSPLQPNPPGAAAPLPAGSAEPLSREELLRRRLEQLRRPQSPDGPDDQ